MGLSMNRMTFVIAAGASFIAAVLTSNAAALGQPGTPLHLIHAIALR